MTLTKLILAASLVVVVTTSAATEQKVIYDGREYPVAVVENRPIDDADLCSLITGTWCEGTIELPAADVFVTFTDESAFYWSVHVM